MKDVFWDDRCPPVYYDWSYGQIKFDWTVLFGRGYSFSGLDDFGEIALGVDGHFWMIWPEGRQRYSMYGGLMGHVAIDAYESRDAAIFDIKRLASQNRSFIFDN